MNQFLCFILLTSSNNKISETAKKKVYIIIIVITFIYTAQIQLYSFQMRLTITDLKIYLTIKDLKIYRKKKIKTLNYNIKLQHYIRKGFFKKVSLV